ncbi:hypothetical protein CABS03_11735 [Colletotrichum abscissum]|uniref:SET domain-containing protein n=2 Tax=Colletotrichum abscissum TaxID=1671311 RepID=A0A9P9X8Z6_9PEZI|nr:hypothetical protein CABS02_09906 [Colletotrichum abscissum]
MGLSSLIVWPWSCLLLVTTIVSSTPFNRIVDTPSPLINIEFEQQCPLKYSSGKAAKVTEWRPWTQEPVCVGPKSNKTLQHCAFIKEDFRGNKVLLVITSPEVAAGHVSLVEDFDTQSASTQPSPDSADPLPFDDETIPGKGLGAVANIRIRAGDVILREHPVVVQLAQVSEPISWMQALWVLEEGFIRLPREDQQRVFELSRSTGGHVLEDIIRTNTFGASFNNVAHLGLFPKVARINHACKPNAITRFSPRTLELEIVAYKDILPGEELSISYSMLNMLYQDRQKALQEWGFNCTCVLCSSSPEVLAISDAYRRRLSEIFSELEDPVIAGSPSLVAELIDELEDILVKEELTAQAGEFYGIVAGVYRNMGEMELSKKYAKLAVEKLVVFAGYDDERTVRAREVLLEFGGTQLGTG